MSNIQNGGYRALVVDPNLASRSKLRHAALALNLFEVVYPVSLLKEATATLSGQDHYDVVFISNRLDRENILEFVGRCRETEVGQDRAYIVVLEPSDQNRVMVASNVLAGVDGFLFEPYSADGIREATEIAEKIKAENAEKRERLALDLLITDVIKLIDQASFDKLCGRESGSLMRELRQTCAALKSLKEELRVVYFDLLMGKLENSIPPPLVSYNGVSKRLKRRLEEKVRLQLREDSDKEEHEA